MGELKTGLKFDRPLCATAYSIGGHEFMVAAQSTAELVMVMDLLTLDHDPARFRMINVTGAKNVEVPK